MQIWCSWSKTSWPKRRKSNPWCRKSLGSCLGRLRQQGMFGEGLLGPFLGKHAKRWRDTWGLIAIKLHFGIIYASFYWIYWFFNFHFSAGSLRKASSTRRRGAECTMELGPGTWGRSQGVQVFLCFYQHRNEPPHWSSASFSILQAALCGTLVLSLSLCYQKRTWDLLIWNKIWWHVVISLFLEEFFLISSRRMSFLSLANPTSNRLGAVGHAAQGIADFENELKTYQGGLKKEAYYFYKRYWDSRFEMQKTNNFLCFVWSIKSGQIIATKPPVGHPKWRWLQGTRPPKCFKNSGLTKCTNDTTRINHIIPTTINHSRPTP